MTDNQERRGAIERIEAVLAEFDLMGELPTDPRDAATAIVDRGLSDYRPSLPALLAETRKKALEEAARVAEDHSPVFQDMEYAPLQHLCGNIAAAIRSISNEEAPK